MGARTAPGDGAPSAADDKIYELEIVAPPTSRRADFKSHFERRVHRFRKSLPKGVRRGLRRK
jgi:hypothetical protein